MKYELWAKTDVFGSEVSDVVELEDNLTEDEIEAQLREVIMDRVEWGYRKVEEE